MKEHTFYKLMNTFESRKLKFNQIKSTKPNHVPILVQKSRENDGIGIYYISTIFYLIKYRYLLI